MDSPLSERDPLTRLLSRRTGLANLRESIERNSQVALLFCDVDHFRTVNTELGFDRGDEELRRIARDLERICAPHPVSRYSGDVCIIVVPEASLEQARGVATEILASQSPMAVAFQGQIVETLSLSVGIALFPTHATNDENLLILADIALLKARRGGRLPGGAPYEGRNRAMAWGDFLDEFPHQSAQFLNPDFVAPSINNFSAQE